MKLTRQAIASAYGVTRQRLHQLCKMHGLITADFSNPDRIFEKLLEGCSSPLRQRLTDYTTRESIRKTFSNQ